MIKHLFFLTVFALPILAGIGPVAADPLAQVQARADAGVAKAQLELGRRFESGDGVRRDDSKALHWFTKAAEQGDAQAQFYLGWMYSNGYGTDQDRVLGYVWFMRAEASGHHDAEDQKSVLARQMSAEELSRARMLLEGRPAPSVEAAPAPPRELPAFPAIRARYNKDGGAETLEALTWLAQSGHAAAQNLLGYHLLKAAGASTEQATKRREAFAWFYKAAKRGHAAAQYNLGVCFLNGWGTLPRADKALRWFEMARETVPSGEPKDYDEATRLFREASEYGHMDVYEAARQGYRSAARELAELIEMRKQEAKARRSLED